MTQAMFGHFFAVKTLVRVAFAALSLGFGIANATPGTGASQGGDSLSLVRGGGG